MPRANPKSPRVLDLKEQIAERLKRGRKALELTQEALAERAGLGRSAVIHYEQGNAYPGALELIQLARALKLSPNYILSGSDVFFPSSAPDRALAQDDINVMASMVALCMMVLGRETAEQVSALLMTLVKHKLSKSKLKVFTSMVDAIRASMPEMEKGVESIADTIAPKVERHMRR